MKLILCIEGLGNGGFIRKGLIEPLQKKHPGKFEVEYCSYKLIEGFSRVPDILVGHSLGGEAALLLGSLGVSQAVVTLDPRRRNLLSFFDFLIPFQKPFTAPAGVKVYNYFRSGFLPGYPVAGAENFKVTGSHGALPGHPSVVAKVEELLGLGKEGILVSSWKGGEA